MHYKHYTLTVPDILGLRGMRFHDKIALITKQFVNYSPDLSLTPIIISLSYHAIRAVMRNRLGLTGANGLRFQPLNIKGTCS